MNSVVLVVRVPAMSGMTVAVRRDAATGEALGAAPSSTPSDAFAARTDCRTPHDVAEFRSLLARVTIVAETRDPLECPRSPLASIRTHIDEGERAAPIS